MHRRIAFLSEHASPTALRGGEDAGGQNVYVDEVSRNLARLGYEVDIFTRRTTDEIPEVLDWVPGVRIIHLTAGPMEFLLKDAIWPFMPAFRDAFLQFIARDRKRYDLIHGNFWMSGWVAAELRRELHIPAVQIFHAMGTTKRKHQGEMDSSPDERITVERDIIQQVDRLIAQCPAEESELVADNGADPRKIALIPSAVNTDVFRPVDLAEARHAIGIDPDGFVIAYIGRMLPRKDVRNMVRALAHLLTLCKERSSIVGAHPCGRPGMQLDDHTSGNHAPGDHKGRPYDDTGITLLLVGGETEDPDPVATPEIGVLRQLAAELGIDKHMSFMGKRQQDQLRYYYSASNVAVTTPWYEPFGLTPLEGMACGRPVIGSAVGGITFTIKDGVTGFLVPPRDPAALAERLYCLLVEPGLSKRMGAAARARVEQEFTWQTVAMRTAALYECLLAEDISKVPIDRARGAAMMHRNVIIW
jgi:D-inositol-3-phosphate glycosyltransferase